MTAQQPYGVEVVEFFKHSESELQSLIKSKEVRYFQHSMSPAYPELGAHIDWHSEKPLTLALQDLTLQLLDGYTVASSMNRPLYLKVQLRKPAPMIDADLIEVTKQAKAEYADSRYQRNSQETDRQIGITVARQFRDAEAKAAKVAADSLATSQTSALADLLAAYAKPKVKTGPADEVVSA